MDVLSLKENSSEDLTEQMYVWETYDFQREHAAHNNITNISKPCSNEYCVSDEDYLDMIENYIFPTSSEWFLIFLHLTVFVIGLIGNALVCLSVYRNHTMRTVTNYFIANLAFADFMVILICLPPTVLWDVTETWFLGKITCKLVVYLQSVSVSVSVLTLTFISVDRWYAICYPLRFKSTSFRAKTSILFIWILSFLIASPDAIVLDTRPASHLRIETHIFTDCAHTWSPNNTAVYQLFMVCVLYLAPFVLMSVAYYQIARVLWNRNIPGTSETAEESSRFRSSLRKPTERNGVYRTHTINANCERQTKSRRKAAKMLVAVVIMFGLCYFPVHLLNILRYTIGLPQTDTTTVLSLVSHWLCYANSAVNPLIYNFMNGKFRKEFKKAFACSRCVRSSYPGGRSSNDISYRFTSSYTQCENINMNSITRNS